MGRTSGLIAGVDLSMTDKNLGILVYEFGGTEGENCRREESQFPIGKWLFQLNC